MVLAQFGTAQLQHTPNNRSRAGCVLSVWRFSEEDEAGPTRPRGGVCTKFLVEIGKGEGERSCSACRGESPAVRTEPFVLTCAQFSFAHTLSLSFFFSLCFPSCFTLGGHCWVPELCVSLSLKLVAPWLSQCGSIQWLGCLRVRWFWMLGGQAASICFMAERGGLEAQSGMEARGGSCCACLVAQSNGSVSGSIWWLASCLARLPACRFDG